MKKKLLGFILAVALMVSMIPTAYAASDSALMAANRLYELDLFRGTGIDEDGNPMFELDRQITRAETITIVLKLLGKADEAWKTEWSIPFTDVEKNAWYRPYVGYAYANHIASGISETTFDPHASVSAPQYITFVLRALGYSDTEGDFEWSRAWELSDRIGLTNGEYNENTASFTRGDVVIITNNALECKLKSSDIRLIDTVDYNTSYGQNVAQDDKTNTQPTPVPPTVSSGEGGFSYAEKVALINEEYLRHTIRATTTPYYGSESEYNAKRSALLSEIARLQSRADILALDDSRQAQAERTKVLNEMNALQAELADLQERYAAKKQIDALRDMLSEYKAQIDAEKREEEALYQRNLNEISNR